MPKITKPMRAYLLSAICGDEDTNLSTDALKVSYFRERFHSEYDWEIKRKGERKALEEYLRGLPSTIDIAFYNHDIIELGVKWGKLKPSADQSLFTLAEQKWCDYWWPAMAYGLMKLFDEFPNPV